MSVIDISPRGYNHSGAMISRKNRRTKTDLKIALQDRAQWLAARHLIDPSAPEQPAGWLRLDPLIPPNSTDPILEIV